MLVVCMRKLVKEPLCFAPRGVLCRLNPPCNAMAKYVYPDSLIPANDADRLRTLAQCNVLDTPEDESFDRVARLAALIFNTPAAFVNFVDEKRVFFKANFSSFPTRNVDRAHSLCSLTILNEDPTVFEDTHELPQLLESPYVNAEGGIRFYAGAPLVMRNGHRIGTVCVIDSEPRLVTPRQMEMLVTLANIIVEKLELERQVADLQAQLA